MEKAAFQSVYSFISPVDKTEKFSALIGVLTPFLTGLQVVWWSKATLLWPILSIFSDYLLELRRENHN